MEVLHNKDEGRLAPKLKEVAGRDEGMKTIGFWGGFVLLVNNVTGPGIVVLPLAYQHTGILGMLLLIALYSTASMVCILFLAESMSRIPGNEGFQGRIEFMQLSRIYFSPMVSNFVLILFLASIVGSNVSAIVESAQMVDQAILSLSPAGTCALRIYPVSQIVCVHEQVGDKDSVFGDDWVISAGYVILAMVTLPFGYLNLGDNIIVQYLAFFGLVLVCAVWCGYFTTLPMHSEKLPFLGTNINAFGYLLYNFSFVITAPSWINEKKPEISIKKSLVYTTLTGAILFVVPCVLAALVLDFGEGRNMLSVLTGASMPLYVRIFSYMFPLVALVTTIPVWSIIMRYNLLENNFCSPAAANFWSVVFPWLLAVIFYGGSLLNYVITWIGITTVGPLNFIIPSCMFLVATQYRLCVPVSDGFDNSPPDSPQPRTERSLDCSEFCLEKEKDSSGSHQDTSLGESESENIIEKDVIRCIGEESTSGDSEGESSDYMIEKTQYNKYDKYINSSNVSSHDRLDTTSSADIDAVDVRVIDLLVDPFEFSHIFEAFPGWSRESVRVVPYVVICVTSFAICFQLASVCVYGGIFEDDG